ncbi:MAG: peptidase dimerization domain-containing protein [Chloroflexi bacterium]|nr:peptidase dimerization domain-containing protein [Chloroflexota bacterium]
MGPVDIAIARAAGAEHLSGELGYTAYERTTIRPSLSVTGLAGGYQGGGNKAVIPARALAKLNLRLVPDQDPRQILQKVTPHIARHVPAGIRASVEDAVGVQPVQLNRGSAALRGRRRADERSGPRLSCCGNGGTIAAVSDIQRRLEIPVVLLGFVLPDARLHTPNENLHLPTFFQAIETSIWLMVEFARSEARAG